MMSYFKKWWFPCILIMMCYGVFSIFGKFGNEISAKKCQENSDRPNCYIFYGIGQNNVKHHGGKLKVNYLIEGFPVRDHTVYVEIIKPSGIDFLYSEQHTANHKSHAQKHGAQRKYEATYKIPKLLKGTYKLRVTFKFNYAFGTKDLVSNNIKFEVM